MFTFEAQAGIEPAHRGFADPSVSTSPLRHYLLALPTCLPAETLVTAVAPDKCQLLFLLLILFKPSLDALCTKMAPLTKSATPPIAGTKGPTIKATPVEPNIIMFSSRPQTPLFGSGLTGRFVFDHLVFFPFHSAQAPPTATTPTVISSAALIIAPTAAVTKPILNNLEFQSDWSSFATDLSALIRSQFYQTGLSVSSLLFIV